MPTPEQLDRLKLHMQEHGASLDQFGGVDSSFLQFAELIHKLNPQYEGKVQRHATKDKSEVFTGAHALGLLGTESEGELRKQFAGKLTSEELELLIEWQDKPLPCSIHYIEGEMILHEHRTEGQYPEGGYKKFKHGLHYDPDSGWEAVGVTISERKPDVENSEAYQLAECMMLAKAGQLVGQSVEEHDGKEKRYIVVKCAKGDVGEAYSKKTGEEDHQFYQGNPNALMIEVAGWLLFLKERGIVHRDLKPSNLFITSDGTVQLIDFGMSYSPSEPESFKQLATDGSPCDLAHGIERGSSSSVRQANFGYDLHGGAQMLLELLCGDVFKEQKAVKHSVNPTKVLRTQADFDAHRHDLLLSIDDIFDLDSMSTKEQMRLIALWMQASTHQDANPTERKLVQMAENHNNRRNVAMSIASFLKKIHGAAFETKADYDKLIDEPFEFDPSFPLHKNINAILKNIPYNLIQKFQQTVISSTGEVDTSIILQYLQQQEADGKLDKGMCKALNDLHKHSDVTTEFKAGDDPHLPMFWPQRKLQWLIQIYWLDEINAWKAAHEDRDITWPELKALVQDKQCESPLLEMYYDIESWSFGSDAIDLGKNLLLSKMIDLQKTDISPENYALLKQMLGAIDMDTDLQDLIQQYSPTILEDAKARAKQLEAEYPRMVAAEKALQGTLQALELQKTVEEEENGDIPEWLLLEEAGEFIPMKQASEEVDTEVTPPRLAGEGASSPTGSFGDGDPGYQTGSSSNSPVTIKPGQALPANHIPMSQAGPQQAPPAILLSHDPQQTEPEAPPPSTKPSSTRPSSSASE